MLLVKNKQIRMHKHASAAASCDHRRHELTQCDRPKQSVNDSRSTHSEPTEVGTRFLMTLKAKLKLDTYVSTSLDFRKKPSPCAGFSFCSSRICVAHTIHSSHLEEQWNKKEAHCTPTTHHLQHVFGVRIIKDHEIAAEWDAQLCHAMHILPANNQQPAE